jgi:hypothetical protein
VVAPRFVELAFWLYIGAAVLSLLNCIYSIAMLPALRTAIEKQQASTSTPLTSAQLDSTFVGVTNLYLVSAAIWILLFLSLALFIRRGANWARIVVTVVSIVSFVNLTNASQSWIGTIQIVVAWTAVVFIWLPSSNKFFRAVKSLKKAGVRPSRRTVPAAYVRNK